MKNPEKVRQYALKGRLPHNTMIMALWDANTGLWTVSLKVPGRPEIHANGTSLFKTQMKADDQYRKIAEET